MLNFPFQQTNAPSIQQSKLYMPMPATVPKQKLAREKIVQRVRVTIRGAVQGVGFRPFVYRLAQALQLTGWVSNSAQGVLLEVEGRAARVESFLLRLEKEKPPRAFIQSLEASFFDPLGYAAFEIRQSKEDGTKAALVLPDIATCPDCLREIFAPSNRRHRYPFTNCTNCGPRFSIITALPYDRAHTTMRDFAMCEACRAEYHEPANRRFHAQPNACPHCGPHVELWDRAGQIRATHDEAIRAAIAALRLGHIVALKGLGGFQLLVAAANENAVQRLRQRKQREAKPFALMYPTLEMVQAHCVVAKLEARLLLAPEAPIVLLREKSTLHDLQASLFESVAPDNPYLGVMLPYTPLHHLLMHDFGSPVVATSGNLSDEPMCIDEHEALQRLGEIADVFLVHNRPIARHVDDSIVRVLLGRELVLRRARGYAPLPIPLQHEQPPILAVGAHLKNSVALAVGQNIFVSQHIGDLETAPAYEAFQRVIEDFQKLYAVPATTIACDMHPEYLSSKFAQQHTAHAPARLVAVQHHFAHVVACMAENELEGTVLGVAWDGTGYGTDGTIWGGEFLRATQTTFERIAHLRTFPLPGGDSAIKAPPRVALGLLYEMIGETIFTQSAAVPRLALSAAELRLLHDMLRQNLNTPRTSSAGRLFDAVAALLGLRQHTKFEGQAAMALEFVIGALETGAAYPFELHTAARRNDLHARENGRAALRHHHSTIIIDWAPMVREIIADQEKCVAVRLIAAKFHNTLVEMIVAIAHATQEERVVLSGGCFQNKYLTERAIRRLRAAGFRPYWHQRIPPNDGGIALGQAVVAGNLKLE